MNGKPRILLVTLKAEAGVNIAPPPGVYQLANYQTRRGVACDIFDRELDPIDGYLEAARNGVYDAIGFSVSHVHMEEDLELLWRFRMVVEEGRHACVFIAGGQEAALNWKQWIELGVDVIFLGFAEKALLAFAGRLESGLPDFGTPLELRRLTEGIQGVAYRDGDGDFVYEPSARLTREEFRELCFEEAMTCHLPYDRYWDRLRAKSADTTLGASDFFIENVRVYTASHCPRRCGFCSSQNFLPQSQGSTMPIIILSADEVAELVFMHVERYGARSFLFSDDDFPVGNKQGIGRLTRFCELMAEAKDAGRIPAETRFSCQARVMDFVIRNAGRRWEVDWPLMRLMAKAGFMSIGTGVETFCDRLLKAPSVNKPAVTQVISRSVIDAMLAAGLVPQTNIMMGVPEYTVDELAETMEISVDNIRKGCDVATTRVMFAYPGAPLFEAGTYPVKYRTWTNPWTGQVAEISDYFIPHDPLLARVMTRYDAAAEAELEKVMRERGWEGKIAHKRVVNVTSMMAVAKMIGKHDLAARFEGFLDELLDRSHPVEGDIALTGT